MKDDKQVQKIMELLGFKKVVKGQYTHPNVGYVFIGNNPSDIADVIFQAGKYAKEKEIMMVLNVQNHIR